MAPKSSISSSEGLEHHWCVVWQNIDRNRPNDLCCTQLILDSTHLACSRNLNHTCVFVFFSLQYLVLGWAVSQRDLEVLIKLVGQLCGGAAAGGGATIVVLTQREKLEIEELFR
eukprot:GHUV01045983.1.p1 GENE.GHUV01045983.1~~GHUV01045983.1.p1  ORF type:complete len:114 (+),score=28.57 GHUV01045983.1:228-569(+)